MWGMAGFIGALMILASFNLCDGHLKFISSITGEVGRGNITHFSLEQQGTLLLEMTSVAGDCDLYVSQFTLRPTYEPHSYCLQSMTCGLDSVIVPKSFKRPFGVGIFGYPTHTDCQYSLMLFEMDDIFDIPSSASDAEQGEGKEETGTDGGKSKSTGEKENDMKETKGKKRVKKLEDAVQEKKLKEERRRRYLGGESYLWLLLDYLIECLLELIL